MAKFGIFIKDDDPNVSVLTKKLIGQITSQGHKVVLTKEQADYLRLKKFASPGMRGFNDVEFIISVGGDGTMLRSARLFSPLGLPILGINLGRRGFLTEIQIDHLPKALPRILKGDHHLDERMMLDVTLKRDGKTIFTTHALNDIVIGKNGLARIIRLKAFINEKPITTYAGDGLIISTPTGSTGHNLAAGGPIIDANLSAFVLTSICPLALANRPVMLAGTEELLVTVQEVPKGMEGVLTADGQLVVPLKPGDGIYIKKSVHATRFIRMKDYNFFSVLKEKLGWGAE